MQPKIQKYPIDDHSINVNEVEALLTSAMDFRVNDVVRSINLTQEAKRRCEEISYTKGLAKSNSQLGLFYMIICENQESLKCSQEAHSQYVELGDVSGQAEALYNIGSVEYKSANYHQGLERLYECLKLHQNLGDYLGQSRTLKAIGGIYEAFDEFDKAMETYLRCREISKKIDDKNGESNACNPLSGLYLRNNDIENALETINTSILYKQKTGDKRGLGFSWYGKGKIHLHLNEHDSAEKLFLKSLKIHEEVQETLGKGYCLMKLGVLYFAKNEYSEAEFYFFKVISEGEKLQNEQLQYRAYKQLFEIAMVKKDKDKALVYHIKYHDLKEKVINLETKGKIKSLESMWRMESLESEAKFQREQNAIVQKKITELEQFSTKLSHDLRGPISSLLGLYDVVKSEVKDDNSLKYFKLYHKSITRINQTIVDLIQLKKVKNWELTKTELNFEEMVMECIDSYNYMPSFNKLTFDLDIQKDMNVVSDRSMMNSIIQNLIENSIKYSRLDIEKPSVKVVIKKTAEDYLGVIVEDNGIGIDKKYQDKIYDMFYRANDEVSGSGLGMYILKSAVDKLNGEVNLESSLGEGTKFVVLVPIETENVEFVDN